MTTPRRWIAPFAGLLGGAVLGIVARSWMRLLTDDPEFSWSGTIFIVGAFAVAGLGQGIAWAGRGARRRRWSVTARTAGAVLTLPMFAGAGMVMLPTVVAGSLAMWRREWRWPVRLVPALLAVAVPVSFIVTYVIDGPTPRTTAGMVLFGLTYALVVAAFGSVVAPLNDGWRMGRKARVVSTVLGLVAAAGTAAMTVGLAAAGA